MTDDNKNPNRPTSTGEIGLMNIGVMGQSVPEQLADFLKQLEISRVMAQVLQDRRYDPNPRDMSQASIPAPTRAMNGWADEVPLRSPPGQDLIKAQCDAALPHAPLSPLRKPPGEETK